MGKREPAARRVTSSVNPRGDVTIFVDDPIPMIWAELASALHEARRNLTRVARRERWSKSRRCAALLVLYEHHIERLGEALHSAETELVRSTRRAQSHPSLLADRTDTILSVAKMDGEKITAKEAVRRAVEAMEPHVLRGTPKNVKATLASRCSQYYKEVARRKRQNDIK